jgi:hypothetical protein
MKPAPMKPDLADASWFPVDLDVPARRFAFLKLAPSALEQSVFLDTRIQAPLADALPLPADRVRDELPHAGAPPGFLFHTSFCCSTLLARLLHLEGRSVALKEPLVLRRLGDARHAGVDAGALTGLAVRLLARPWSVAGRVLIKPTHAALNVAPELLAAAPDARAVLLHGTLEDFLVSNIKKPPASQQKVPELVERALRASGWHERLSAAALAPPDFLSGVALQWCAQLELAGALLAGPQGARVRVLRERDLLADVPGTAGRVAEWLGWEFPRGVIEARAAEVAGRHAKQPDAAYGAERRAAEAAMLRERFGDDIDRALAWAGRLLFPAMRTRELAPVL